MEALTDAVRGEVMEFGIDVVLIAPGLIKTEFVPKQLAYSKQSHIRLLMKSYYGRSSHRVARTERPRPAIIAQAVLDAITTSNPPVRHALPLDSKMAVVARWLLGARLFAWAIRRQMKVETLMT